MTPYTHLRLEPPRFCLRERHHQLMVCYFDAPQRKLRRCSHVACVALGTMLKCQLAARFAAENNEKADSWEIVRIHNSGEGVMLFVSRWWQTEESGVRKIDAFCCIVSWVFSYALCWLSLVGHMPSTQGIISHIPCVEGMCLISRYSRH